MWRWVDRYSFLCRCLPSLFSLLPSFSLFLSYTHSHAFFLAFSSHHKLAMCYSIQVIDKMFAVVRLKTSLLTFHLETFLLASINPLIGNLSVTYQFPWIILVVKFTILSASRISLKSPSNAYISYTLCMALIY